VVRVYSMVFRSRAQKRTDCAIVPREQSFDYKEEEGGRKGVEGRGRQRDSHSVQMMCHRRQSTTCGSCRKGMGMSFGNKPNLCKEKKVNTVKINYIKKTKFTLWGKSYSKKCRFWI
jgi:hypothetical protein